MAQSSHTLKLVTDIQLRDGVNKLFLDLSACFQLRIPHKGWLEDDMWKQLMAQASTNLIVCIRHEALPSPSDGMILLQLSVKLLWKHGALPTEWSFITDGIGKILANAKVSK